MIKKIEKFFCMTPLLLALFCVSFVNGDQIAPPKDIHDQLAEDCIKDIRQKQDKIKQEIKKIKEIIKDNRRNSHPEEKP